jgi:hypothetical protein
MISYRVERVGQRRAPVKTTVENMVVKYPTRSRSLLHPLRAGRDLPLAFCPTLSVAPPSLSG